MVVLIISGALIAELSMFNESHVLAQTSSQQNQNSTATPTPSSNNLSLSPPTSWLQFTTPKPSASGNSPGISTFDIELIAVVVAVVVIGIVASVVFKKRQESQAGRSQNV